LETFCVHVLCNLLSVDKCLCPSIGKGRLNCGVYSLFQFLKVELDGFDLYESLEFVNVELHSFGVLC
jgi:hypothetical protein